MCNAKREKKSRERKWINIVYYINATSLVHYKKSSLKSTYLKKRIKTKLNSKRLANATKTRWKQQQNKKFKIQNLYYNENAK